MVLYCVSEGLKKISFCEDSLDRFLGLHCLLIGFEPQEIHNLLQIRNSLSLVLFGTQDIGGNKTTAVETLWTKSISITGKIMNCLPIYRIIFSEFLLNF